MRPATSFSAVPAAAATDGATALAGTGLRAAAGATAEMPPCDMFYGFRCGSIRDPFGHQWLIQHEIEKVTQEEMQRRWDAIIEQRGCQSE